MAIYLYRNDLPDGLDMGPSVAVDTETTGLSLTRDRLCLVQLSAGDGDAHLVQIEAPVADCPNLARLLADAKTEKLFHFARFDLAMLTRFIGPVAGPVFCTKIASKLVRTYTDRHGLRDLCAELLQKDISKQQQSSDWARAELSQAQQDYAAQDVLYLHQLKERLAEMLAREGRSALAAACFDFLSHRTSLDLGGFEAVDIFHH